MNSSIVSLVIITVFGGPQVSSSHAQLCMDPNDPNCISTNAPSGTNYSDYTWPTNGLVWSISGVNQFELHPLAPNQLYDIERSIDLLNWSLLIGPFTNGVTNSFSIDTTNEMEFFRAKNVQFQTIYANPASVTGYNPCYGSYQALANYHPSVKINTNTILHSIADGSGLNRNIQAVGENGDIHCGYSPLFITNPVSTAYGITLLFSNNVPTNPYPLIIGGFVP